MSSELRLVVAAGGTGGHLYPALAVAKEFLRRDPEAEVIFSGTRRGLESRIVPGEGFRLELVRVEPLRGGSLLRKMNATWTLLPAFWDAVMLLRKLRPSVVMGVGGYVAGPVLAVAGLSGVPSLLLEPNAAPGLANRWLAPLVDAAALAWEETRSYFGSKGFVSGNPVREEITRVRPRPATENLHLLVFGGSQGSQVLNRAMGEALPHLQTHRDRFRIIHQTGPADLESVRASYRRERISARVEPYLDNMAEEYEASDLVVCRAGATTCAELAAAGRASVLVPLPLAGAHQRQNAEMMERHGAARVILQDDLSGRKLAGILTDLLDAPEQRRQMAARARELARPEAAAVIADRLLTMAGRGREAAG